jgi:hypothetical protein
VQRIGRRLDRAVHITLANGFVMCVPFIVCEAASTVAADLTGDDWNGYFIWLGIAYAFATWARITVVRLLRGDRFARAAETVLRRPALAAYWIVACAEPWLSDIEPNIIALPVFVVGALIIFATQLALVDSVAEGVPPPRALAHWLLEMCRPRRLGINLIGALVVGCLTAVVPWMISDLPFGDSPPLQAVYAAANAIGDAFAMVFVVLWHDAALNERYGRDIEQQLDASSLQRS